MLGKSVEKRKKEGKKNLSHFGAKKKGHKAKIVASKIHSQRGSLH